MSWPSWTHLFVGLGVVILTAVHVALGVMLFLGFIIYETNEDWHISDGAWKDIRWMLWGLVGAGAAWGIINWPKMMGWASSRMW